MTPQAIGALGILIPPSVIMVIYALAAEESVPALFAAGMIPGLILAALFVVVIWVIARIRPDRAPAGPRMPWRERVLAALAMRKLIILVTVPVFLPDIELVTMFKGIAPFLVADAVLIALLLLFPQIALWLPGTLFP